MLTIKYRGFRYRLAADSPGGGGPPPGMSPTTPADPRNLAPQDGEERKPTKIEPEKKHKPLPYDPRVEREKDRLGKKKERLEKISLPVKSLSLLIERYHLPSVQILIRDFTNSKERLLEQLDRAVKDLGELAGAEETDL